MNIFKSFIPQIGEFWKNIDRKNRIRIIVSAAIIIAVAGIATWILSRPEYVVLYSGLDGQEAGEIYTLIEDMGVTPKAVGSGTIKVPKKNESRIRMQLAAEGYPKSGRSNDYFDIGMGLGATDYDKRMAAQLQLQNRLEKAIETMEGVKSAIVTISIPEQDSFVLKDDKVEPSASVVLILKDGFLNNKQVRGIEQLVSKSVGGLKPENISIIDNNMNPLSNGDTEGIGNVGTQFDLELQLKKNLEKQVMTLLEPIFGKNRVMASVNVRLNFDKKVTSKVEFNPVVDDEGIAVSINELKESVSSSAAPEGSQPEGALQYPVYQGSGQGDYTNTNRSINYEVNETKEQIEEAQGKITELALSVLIDNPDLGTQMLSRIQKVVSTALGVTLENVVVEGMSFSALAEEQDKIKTAEEKASNELFKRGLIDIGYKVLLGLLLFFALFIVYRFVRGIKVSVSGESYIDKEYEQLIDEAVEISQPGVSYDQAVKKRRIESIVETKPDVVARQIKEWLNEN